ncbi:23S rRNA (uracil(1939)-C(5))-methyltransferase RlmD [Bacillus sp. JCM 19034]|uniref:23S rRNA (uracil(1939)-C(5))-methyltransferase RlmD n=1 Tax=Bacillus sp. JCM 19034 TaxID=1481928 RepID=UPI000783E4DB|nr:23S rRNA (uracil(1939)-C(5))-methyltransferase RlmD [Bacillus sp. JCM 19034]
MKKQAPPPVKKNDQLQVTIEDLTHEGAGVAKVEGYTLFVPKALPGEKVDIKVTKTNKGYGFARLMNINEESTHRIEPLCPIYQHCGGCQMQHMSYEGQLLFKQKQVKDVLERIGGLKEVPVLATIGMAEPWRYRNKAQVPIGEEAGLVIGGFYQERSHRIIDTDQCIIQTEESDQVVQLVKRMANQYGIRAYNEEKHSGILRHVVTRKGYVTDELMVILVTRGKDLPQKQKLIDAICEQVPNVKSIVQNINSKRTNVIFGDKTSVLWGEEYIYDYIGDIKFAISARSFFQVNPEQTKVLYEKALQYANLTGSETVIDAYCGIGTISLFLAQKAKHVYGVEIVSDAITDAKRNAKLNEISNVDFAVGEAEKVMPWWYGQGIRPEVIVVDPPRKGCDQALLDTILSMKPQRVVYVSCNPATLARDLKVLESGGYKTVEVQPVDMFPHSTHVECCSLLIYNGKKVM